MEIRCRTLTAAGHPGGVARLPPGPVVRRVLEPCPPGSCASATTGSSEARLPPPVGDAGPSRRGRGERGRCGRPPRSRGSLPPPKRPRRASSIDLREPFDALTPELTKFAASRVRAPTRRSYLAALRILSLWLGARALPAWDGDAWDEALEDFALAKYAEGAGRDLISRVLAGVLWAIPRLIGPIRVAFPRTAQVWRAWKARHPEHSRPPIPWLLVQGVAMSLVQRGTRLEAEFALALLTLFATYARPCELLELRVFQVVMPSPYAAGSAAQLTFLLNAEELEHPGKTGDVDVSLPLDLEYHQFLVPLWRAFVRGKAGHMRVWSFEYPQLRQAWRDASSRLRLGHLRATLYGLRHGGASHDRSLGLRHLSDIQKRGGWRSHSSVVRYEKHGRLGRQLQRLGAARCEELRRLVEDFEANFTGCFMPHFASAVGGRASC